MGVDGRVFDLFSFKPGAGVDDFIHSGIIGLFQDKKHGDDRASISFLYKGMRCIVGAVYIPLSTSAAEWDHILVFMSCCDIIVGDFNA